jgi:predicted GNAT family acetyltransferase
MDARPTRLATNEVLFVLELDALVVPDFGSRTVRRATAADVPLLGIWRRDYGIETLADPPDSDEKDGRERIEASLASGHVWVACEEGAPVAMTSFNAHTGDSVQVGGVFTPKAARGRGLARIAVAGSLLDARAEGARTAILFTGDENAAAQSAYRALGFAQVGDYGMIFFAD